MKPFKYLCKLVPIVLVIPYRKAKVAQLFSMVKSLVSPCLKQSETLSNLLGIKTFH